jgi:hypothetical protein
VTELNRHQEAHQTLSEAVMRFPSDEIILYDLTCVCCALKRIDEARGWLAKAIEVSGNEIKLKVGRLGLGANMERNRQALGDLWLPAVAASELSSST